MSTNTNTLSTSCIQSQVALHGIIHTVKSLSMDFNGNMNPHIADPSLRISVWQINHTISHLQDKLNITITEYDSVKAILNAAPTDRYIIISAQHLLNALDFIDHHFVVDGERQVK